MSSLAPTSSCGRRAIDVTLRRPSDSATNAPAGCVISVQRTIRGEPIVVMGGWYWEHQLATIRTCGERVDVPHTDDAGFLRVEATAADARTSKRLELTNAKVVFTGHPIHERQALIGGDGAQSSKTSRLGRAMASTCSQRAPDTLAPANCGSKGSTPGSAQVLSAAGGCVARIPEATTLRAGASPLVTRGRCPLPRPVPYSRPMSSALRTSRSGARRFRVLVAIPSLIVLTLVSPTLVLCEGGSGHAAIESAMSLCCQQGGIAPTGAGSSTAPGGTGDCGDACEDTLLINSIDVSASQKVIKHAEVAHAVLTVALPYNAEVQLGDDFAPRLHRAPRSRPTEFSVLRI